MRTLTNILDRLPVDNKLIGAGVAYLLTLLVARVGLELTDVLVPGYLTVAQGISLAASALAGYLVPNEGSVLRGHGADDGNANANASHLPFEEVVPGEQGAGLVELIVVVFVAIIAYVLVAAVTGSGVFALCAGLLVLLVAVANDFSVR